MKSHRKISMKNKKKEEEFKWNPVYRLESTIRTYDTEHSPILSQSVVEKFVKINKRIKRCQEVHSFQKIEEKEK